MKVRILSQSGDALAVTDRLNAEVDMAFSTQPDPQTVVMFDRAGFGAVAEKMANPVFGAGKIHDSLELNPDFGRQIAQANGISVKPAKGPKMSIDAFYMDGRQTGLLLSSVMAEGNAICRVWKNAEPKIYRLILAKMEGFLSRFKYTGALSCECVISDMTPYFVRWIAHIQPHILWAVGPWLPVAMGIEPKNGQNITYDWIGIIRLSEQPCFLSAEHRSLSVLKDMLRKHIKSVSVCGKKVVDNLDALTGDIETLKRSKFL